MPAYEVFPSFDLEDISLRQFLDGSKQAKRPLHQIVKSDSRSHCVKRSARAAGLVPGMSTLAVVPGETLGDLDILFSKATDNRLVELSR